MAMDCKGTDGNWNGYHLWSYAYGGNLNAKGRECAHCGKEQVRDNTIDAPLSEQWKTTKEGNTLETHRVKVVVTQTIEREYEIQAPGRLAAKGIIEKWFKSDNPEQPTIFHTSEDRRIGEEMLKSATVIE